MTSSGKKKKKVFIFALVLNVMSSSLAVKPPNNTKVDDRGPGRLYVIPGEFQMERLWGDSEGLCNNSIDLGIGCVGEVAHARGGKQTNKAG